MNSAYHVREDEGQQKIWRIRDNWLTEHSKELNRQCGGLGPTITMLRTFETHLRMPLKTNEKYNRSCKTMKKAASRGHNCTNGELIRDLQTRNNKLNADYELDFIICSGDSNSDHFSFSRTLPSPFSYLFWLNLITATKYVFKLQNYVCPPYCE